MSASTRVNGGGSTHATLYSVVQLKAFVIDAGATLASSGGVNGALEALIQEVQPLMYESVSTSGVVHVIVDGHAVDSDTLQARIRAIGNVSTPYTYDFTGATVTLGSHITVS